MTKTIIGALLGAVVLLLPAKVYSKSLVVAVIDTGIDSEFPALCASGHRDFTVEDPAQGRPLVDVEGHGTHIAGIIRRNAANAPYCVVSLKFYDKTASGSVSTQRFIAAIKYAVNQLKADVINMSVYGANPSSEEFSILKKATANHITVVVAAGNSASDLDKNCDAYPACYKLPLVVVGNLRENLTLSDRSNFGSPVNRWEVGTNVLSNLPNGRAGRMSGTSQAAAVATGKIIKSHTK